MTPLRVGSLFSGIGGLDLGLERAGMTVVWNSEIDPYACQVLAKHWPTVPNLGDITTIDWSTVEPVDLICGGYPCQPFSLAGARQGESDPRHLWPHFAEALRVVRPRWALLENVPGHLSLGFGRVLGDLAELGFDAEWDCIPAAAVGAPHLRYRVFIVAHTDGAGQRESGRTVAVPSQLAAAERGRDAADADSQQLRQQPVSLGRFGGASLVGVDGPIRHVADTEGIAIGAGLRSCESRGERRGRSCDCGSKVTLADATGCGCDRIAGRTDARRETTVGRQEVDPAEHSSSSLGGHWAIEPDVGRVAHGVPSRVDRLRTLGNAVVPQVAEFIGRRIMEVAA